MQYKEDIDIKLYYQMFLLFPELILCGLWWLRLFWLYMLKIIEI